MRTSHLLLALGFVSLLAACFSLKITNDYDPAVDFTRYKSYDWLDQRPGVPDRVTTTMGGNRAFDGRVRQAVSSELSANGLAENHEDPELLVTYHIGAGDKIEVAAWGYRYRGSYGGWYRDIDVVPYREGALVLDLIDGKTMELVWRASAQNTIGEKMTPEQTEQRIADAVSRMFAGYPPR